MYRPCMGSDLDDEGLKYASAHQCPSGSASGPVEPSQTQTARITLERRSPSHTNPLRSGGESDTLRLGLAQWKKFGEKQICRGR